MSDPDLSHYYPLPSPAVFGAPAWHSRQAFRLIAAGQWRSLVRVTTLDLERTLGRFFEAMPPSSLEDIGDYRATYEMLYPPASPWQIRFSLAILQRCELIDAWTMNLVNEAIYLAEDARAGSEDHRKRSACCVALSLFLAAEAVAAQVCRLLNE